MVVFVDHEQTAYSHLQSGGPLGTLVKEADGLSSNYASNRNNALPLGSSAAGTATTPTTPTEAAAANGFVERGMDENSRVISSYSSQQANLNAEHGLSAALSCYPVVKEIARSVDLNTLDALSMTCRQFRANLLQFRNQLVRETLHCRNERLEHGRRTEAEDWFPGLANGSSFTGKGKASRCARDMVGECQRCAKVVCRNCTTKHPSTEMFKNRLRRLCHTCLEAPLSRHLSSDVSTPDVSARPHQRASTETWGMREPCSCETEVWLCRPCAHALYSDDISYRRDWSWQTRPNTFVGDGLATEIEECQGVKCGRQGTCLAAEGSEVEVDCDVDDWDPDQSNCYLDQHHRGECRDDVEPGYLRQEIDGIGGVVKHKVKKTVMVGASVDQSDREREKGVDLEPERSGAVRSWCAWCSRIMPSKTEAAEV